MPAIIDDPSSSTIYRVSGERPFPDPKNPALPANIQPRKVTLRDRQTVATVVPFVSKDQVPPSLLLYLADQFAKEIVKGDTYPMMEPMSHEAFASYWFQNFGAIVLLGHVEKPEDVVEGQDWSKQCLGSFYIKPNYPGRSSHICNAGFLVTDAARNRGVGRLMGEAYLNWAPKLGYSYSVFNLVYETNVASCRIWDALGFKRIGRVAKCGNLRSYPDRLVDAIIYGRDLSVGENEPGTAAADNSNELVSQERFERIKFYLKHGKYPDGADRAEKSRLRSSAIHYTLIPGRGGTEDNDDDVLMFNSKECIADAGRQYEIAREVHARRLEHGGINKTTAAIAEKYHWSRIKDTVSDVIRVCRECNEVKDRETNTAKASPAVTTLPVSTQVSSRTTNSTDDPVNGSATLPRSNARQSRAVAENTTTVSRPQTHFPGVAARDVLAHDFVQVNDLPRSNDEPGLRLDTEYSNDPDLSAIYQYLIAPLSPPPLHHHDQPPIDPRLTSPRSYGSQSNYVLSGDSMTAEVDSRHEAPGHGHSPALSALFVEQQQQQQQQQHPVEGEDPAEVDGTMMDIDSDCPDLYEPYVQQRQ